MDSAVSTSACSSRSCCDSRLFVYTAYEKKRIVDDILENCYKKIQVILKSDPSGRQISQHVLVDCQQHDEIIFGYFYALLTDPSSADENFRNILLHSQDHLESVTCLCNDIIVRHLHDMHLQCKLQVCWFIEQGVRTGIKRLSSLIHQLLRELQVLPEAARDHVVRMFEKNLNWVLSTSILPGMIVYTLIPLIRKQDKCVTQQSNDLNQRMVNLCVLLVRRKWSECARIGRDFIRALHSVCVDKGFFDLWQDILNQKMTDQQDNQLEVTLFQKTQKKFLLSRLTHEMERKIAFILNEVRFNSDVGFYLDWLHRTLSVTNRIDLIRYLCSPACEVVVSDRSGVSSSGAASSSDHQRSNPNREDIRRHVLYWLVTYVDELNTVDVLNIRLAVVYDWLMYHPNRNRSMDPDVLKYFDWSPQYLIELSKSFIPSMRNRLQDCVHKFLSDVFNYGNTTENLSPVNSKDSLSNHKTNNNPLLMDYDNISGSGSGSSCVARTGRQSPTSDFPSDNHQPIRHLAVSEKVGREYGKKVDYALHTLPDDSRLTLTQRTFSDNRLNANDAVYGATMAGCDGVVENSTLSGSTVVNPSAPEEERYNTNTNDEYNDATSGGSAMEMKFSSSDDEEDDCAVGGNAVDSTISPPVENIVVQQPESDTTTQQSLCDQQEILLRDDRQNHRKWGGYEQNRRRRTHLNNNAKQVEQNRDTASPVIEATLPSTTSSCFPPASLTCETNPTDAIEKIAEIANRNHRFVICPPQAANPQKIKECLRSLPKVYREHVRLVMKSPGSHDRYTKMRSFIQNLSSTQEEAYLKDTSNSPTIDKLSKGDLTCLAMVLLHLMKYSLPSPLLPIPDDEIVEPASRDDTRSTLSIRLLKRPLFLFFKMVSTEPCLIPLLDIMYSLQPKLGYLFLLYLYIRNPSENNLYRDAKEFERLFVTANRHLSTLSATTCNPVSTFKEMQLIVEKAMVNCHRDEEQLFYFLLMFVSDCRIRKQSTPKHTTTTTVGLRSSMTKRTGGAASSGSSNNKQQCTYESRDPMLRLNSESVVRLIATSITEDVLNELGMKLLGGEIALFAGNKHLRSLVIKSAEWTYLERLNLLLLMNSQLPHTTMSSLMRHVRQNPIASLFITQHIANSQIRSCYLRSIFARQPPDDNTRKVLSNWCEPETLRDFIDEFTSLVASLRRVRKRVTLKRNRRWRKTSSPTTSDCSSSSVTSDNGGLVIAGADGKQLSIVSDVGQCVQNGSDSGAASFDESPDSTLNDLDSDGSGLDLSDEDRNPHKANCRHKLTLAKILSHLDYMRTDDNNTDWLKFILDRHVCCSMCRAIQVVGLSQRKQQRYRELLRLIGDFSKENEIFTSEGTPRRGTLRRPAAFSEPILVISSEAEDDSDTSLSESSSTSSRRKIRKLSEKRSKIPQKTTNTSGSASTHSSKSESYGWKPAIRTPSSATLSKTHNSIRSQNRSPQFIPDLPE